MASVRERWESAAVRFAASLRNDRGRDLKEGSLPVRPFEGKRMEPLSFIMAAGCHGRPASGTISAVR